MAFYRDRMYPKLVAVLGFGATAAAALIAALTLASGIAVIAILDETRRAHQA